ncbi:cobalamin biosynthesis protein CbiX [Pelagicoccus sp. NFK12]|uniref:Cobalamin biosynthesis protein CbiX n=1 Tax=Pelagicoccus enzymogenes TaxID=2773457 RepID=A0A927F635_9BACT|nr:CbiX/SirB N-terminal domain-containing protein [Pelagicoccus enzymogenes]MBD5779079.1 cobalamin biosynthesis protein CbiX [Pelagicoccus enzymogenes]
MAASEECIVLLDNGSLRPEAVFSLRSIAGKLESRIGKKVHPVSLLHSSKIDAEKLGGVEAETWRRFLRRRLEEGVAQVRVVPLFFGPSSAIADYLPKVSAEALASYAGAEVKVAEPLVDLERGGDDAVAEMLESLSIQKMDTSPGGRVGVVVVDHGSPLKAVAQCRDLVASRLAARLGDRVSGVIAASMERREGEEYDFNEPLLEKALSIAAERGWKRVLLSYLFFSPGRHAGPGGDIDRIVAESDFARGGGEVLSAPLVGESPLLVELLARRYHESLEL